MSTPSRKKYARERYAVLMLDPDYRKKTAARHREWYANLSEDEKSRILARNKKYKKKWDKENPDYYILRRLRIQKKDKNAASTSTLNRKKWRACAPETQEQKMKKAPCVRNPYGATNKWEWYQGLLKDQQARDARKMGVARSTIE